MLLFIQSYLNDDDASLKFKLAIVGFMWAIVTIAMTVDLLSGYNKAKQREEARTSYGLRRTVQKAVLYFALMLFAFLFDCIGTFFYSLPFVTLVSSAFLVFIEGKSILEKAHDKDKRRINGNINDVAIFLENKDDLAKAIAEIIKSKTKENKESGYDIS